jgi:hypothetical protein
MPDPGRVAATRTGFSSMAANARPTADRNIFVVEFRGIAEEMDIRNDALYCLFQVVTRRCLNGSDPIDGGGPFSRGLFSAAHSASEFPPSWWTMPSTTDGE